jgi:PAS domain S-box-containing protein
MSLRLQLPKQWTAAALVSLVWLIVVALAVVRLRQADGIIVALTGLAATLATFGILAWTDRVRWQNPIKKVTRSLYDLRENPRIRRPAALQTEPILAALAEEIAALAQILRKRPIARPVGLAAATLSASEPQGARSMASLTRSGLYDAPPPLREVHGDAQSDPGMSGDYSTADMVNRLEPVGFRWIESSTAEQILLGWTVDELRQKTFLEVLHPDDRRRAEETFAQALNRGEALGLVVRVRTSHGSTRAIEVNVGARYDRDQQVTHLRCHLTDVTDKVRAERALRLRTLELTRVNEQLREINRELEELKDRLAQDVMARRRLEAELLKKNQSLARANDELSQRNRELDEFVYVVSHDLQEPLRTLMAFSDFLSRDYGDRLEAEGQEFVRYLVDASRRMRAMIHGMLNLARVGKVVGEYTLVNLGELVAVIKADLAELSRSKGAELRTVDPLPLIWGDHNRIGQLLANLISNGIKYNKSATPWVEIRVVDPAGGDSPGVLSGADPTADVTIAITDNGIGIEPQFHATIFQLFRRLHTREEFEGTGAGLAICNKIVQAHGGRIWVESSLGEGSTFFVRLPDRPSSASTTPRASTTASIAPLESSVSQVQLDEPNAR